MPKDNLIVDSPSQCTGYTKTFWVLELVVRYFIVAQTAVPNLIKNLTTTKDPTCSFTPQVQWGQRKVKEGGRKAPRHELRDFLVSLLLLLVVASVAAIFTLYLFTFLLCALAHEFKYLPVAPCCETATETDVQ